MRGKEKKEHALSLLHPAPLLFSYQSSRAKRNTSANQSAAPAVTVLPGNTGRAANGKNSPMGKSGREAPPRLPSALLPSRDWLTPEERETGGRVAANRKGRGAGPRDAPGPHAWARSEAAESSAPPAGCGRRAAGTHVPGGQDSVRSLAFPLHPQPHASPFICSFGCFYLFPG